jgi:hypothetical protein
MSWTPITDLPPTRLYEDEYGNIRRISLASGEFISGNIWPEYGVWAYGATVDLQAIKQPPE